MNFLGLFFVAIGAWFIDSGIQNRAPIGTLRDLIQHPQPLADALSSSHGTWQSAVGTASAPTDGTVATSNVVSSSFSSASHPSGQSGHMPSSQLTSIPWAPMYKLRPDAEAALEQLNNAYRLQFGHNLIINDAYRSYERQVILRASLGTQAAPPGTSNHGWGTAVDLGGISYGNAMDAWMLQNAPHYGWHRPSWAVPGGVGPHEPWHWEYGA